MFNQIVCVKIIIIVKLMEIDMKPQLDLPPNYNIGNLDIIPNSYTVKNNNNNNQNNNEYNNNNNSYRDDFDRDRSFRYGPPYDADGIRHNNNNNNTIKNGQIFSSNENITQLINRYGNGQSYSADTRTNQENFVDQYRENYQQFNNNNNDDDERYRQREQQNHNLRLINEQLRNILQDIDRRSSLECTLNVRAQWNFETNVHEITQLEAVNAQQRYSDFQRSVREQLQTIDTNEIYDHQLYRQINMLKIIGPSALPPDQLDRYNRLINDMLAIYNKASICGYQQPFNCGLRLQPHLKEIMAKSRDWDELQYTWTEWRRKSGTNMKDLFEQMIELTNEAAILNNFTNAANYWTFPFESDTFRDDIENVWNDILPLYELIHAYVRRKLREFYGPDKIQNSAPLPDHIFGNMYGQNWINILDIIIPYPGRSFLDVTPQMQQQGYTPSIMFQLAEEFFISINMTSLPTDFWIDSIFVQPLDRTILCSPSAWDFCNERDYRIKMCTQVNHKHLLTVHQELAHIQYFLHYRDQPKVFRDGANSAFHEAIGDVIALSVATPKHLQALGLVQKSVDDIPHDINYLFALAIDKVVFLPFALALDVWRWDIFNKKVNKEQYNCYWWFLREKYGGIKPPVLRSELDFDPGSKYHVPANIPYIRYFFGTILQFQLHRALCKASQQYNPVNPDKPLHKCDIYRQPIAGNILKQIMEKGSSQSWQTILQDTIGESRLDGMALREFFRPLEEWLRNENLRNQEFVGWSYDGDYCKHSIETANLKVYGGFYNRATAITSKSYYKEIIYFYVISIVIRRFF